MRPVMDSEILLEAFGEPAAHAEAEGVVITLEPLKPVQNHMINTLDQAQALCETIDSGHFGIVTDTYHMNIEETAPLRAF
jgi:D-psicose/D-tagatose/L-ribulose 3-epimerase